MDKSRNTTTIILTVTLVIIAVLVIASTIGIIRLCVVRIRKHKQQQTNLTMGNINTQLQTEDVDDNTQVLK